MGNAQSVEGGSSQIEHKVGYHVLQVQPNSPGDAAGLVSFFDFIVAINDQPLLKEDSTFVETLQANVDKPVRLVVYNSRLDSTRQCTLRPSLNWGGKGLAGISIRFCSFENISDHTWHVLDVYPESPAADAGLESRTDYIVGTPDLLFSDSEDFFALINQNMGKPIRLYVYSSVTDSVRLVTIVANPNWGGSGALGCDVGFGYLHRIPTQAQEPPMPAHAVPPSIALQAQQAAAPVSSNASVDGGAITSGGAASDANGAPNAASDAATPQTRRLHPLMVPANGGQQFREPVTPLHAGAAHTAASASTGGVAPSQSYVGATIPSTHSHHASSPDGTATGLAAAPPKQFQQAPDDALW